MSKEQDLVKHVSEVFDGLAEQEWNETKLEKWYKDTLREGMMSVRSHKVGRPQAGKLYAFGYGAKTARTLPYWDQYPLVIVLKVQGPRMWGLNLHYIPPKQRKEFLDVVMRYSNTKTVSNNTMLKIPQNRLSNMKWVPHMLKQYLFSHVVETFQEIKPQDWDKAVMLRTQKFTYKDTGRSISATVAYNDRNKR